MASLILLLLPGKRKGQRKRQLPSEVPNGIWQINTVQINTVQIRLAIPEKLHVLQWFVFKWFVSKWLRRG